MVTFTAQVVITTDGAGALNACALTFLCTSRPLRSSTEDAAP